MFKESYTYNLDDRLPFPYAALYGLQWAVVTFPFAIISVKICWLPFFPSWPLCYPWCRVPWSVLRVAMGGQVGIAISIITAKTITSRDFFVVGIPVFLGTLVGFLPQGLFDTLPKFSKVFLGNSLIVGIVMVLLLEHILMPKSNTSRGYKIES
jgi:xanthine/uracil permease